MPLLQVRGLVKRYGRREVVSGVDYEVERGEVVGLLGPNGAGKTTSFRMTTGQIVPEGGQVFFAGAEVTEFPMYRRARLGMGYLSQEPSVFRKLSVEKNILAVLEALPMSRELGRKLRYRERWDRTDAVLEQFGLTHIRKNNAWRCSGRILTRKLFGTSFGRLRRQSASRSPRTTANNSSTISPKPKATICTTLPVPRRDTLARP